MPAGLLDRARQWLPGQSTEALLARARTASQAGRAAEALAIWTRLAEAGVPRAQTNRGACLANGTGIAADPQAARHWLQLGAEAGDTLGQRNLGSLLLPDDPAAAVPWYRRAAEAGDAVSQDQLSRMLLAGTGTAKDAAAARHWAELAARQGIAAAAARLGTMCHEADGGPRDAVQAARWWQMAAEAGDGDAAARLGAALHMGQGVAADQVAAMAWLLVASGRHSILVRPFLTRVRDGLTPAEFAAAQAAAAKQGWSAGTG